MRRPVALTGAVAALSALAVVLGTAAAADVPLPVPVLPSVPAPGVPGLPVPPVPGGGGPGTPAGPVAPVVPTPPLTGGGSAPGQPAPAARAQAQRSAADASPGAAAATTPRARPAPRSTRKPLPRTSVRPMITGRPEADDAVDDESAPALRKATEQFLAADAGIAEITKQQHAMDAAREGAGRAAADYQALGQEAANLRGQANDLSTRHDAAVRTIVAYARTAYRNGRLGVDADDAASSLAVSARRLVEARTRAELRLGAIATRQAGAREEFNRFSAQYTGAVRALADATQRLNQLAAQRATALAKAQAARHEDLTRHQVRLAESGRFGDQIRSAAQALRASGRAVSGTGRFGRPAVGPVTSSFGPRLHPILGYVKLHTGVDFGRGDGTVYAADDGTVLYTMVSTAYGNLTVVDHGVIAGRHITTAYAHQAQFLVQPGDRVGKGQAIGLIGSTGYSTGPHLHFEVRDDGVPVDPMPWLSAR